MRRYRKIRISPKVPQPTRFLFEEMIEQQCSMFDMCERSGVSMAALDSWKTDRKDRNRSSPTVVNLEACLNVLGYTLKPVPLQEL